MTIANPIAHPMTAEIRTLAGMNHQYRISSMDRVPPRCTKMRHGRKRANTSFPNSRRAASDRTFTEGDARMKPQAHMVITSATGTKAASTTFAKGCDSSMMYLMGPIAEIKATKRDAISKFNSIEADTSTKEAVKASLLVL